MRVICSGVGWCEKTRSDDVNTYRNTAGAAVQKNAPPDAVCSWRRLRGVSTGHPSRFYEWYGGTAGRSASAAGARTSPSTVITRNTNIGTLIMTVTRHSPTRPAPSYTAGTSVPTDRWRACLFLYGLVNDISMAQSHRRRAAPTRPPINEALHHGEYTRPSEVARGCVRDRLGLCQGRRQRHAVGYKRPGPDHPQSLRPAHGSAVARSRRINRGPPHTFSRPQRTSQTSRS